MMKLFLLPFMRPTMCFLAWCSWSLVCPGWCTVSIKAVTVSKTKSYHAVIVLPQEVTAQILDLIWAPPSQTPNEVLKDRLITLYSLNDYQRFQALVSLPLSGDQKPSHEQDACSSPWPVQARFYSWRFVLTLTPYWSLILPFTGENIWSSSFSFESWWIVPEQDLISNEPPCWPFQWFCSSEYFELNLPAGKTILYSSSISQSSSFSGSLLVSQET